MRRDITQRLSFPFQAIGDRVLAIFDYLFPIEVPPKIPGVKPPPPPPPPPPPRPVSPLLKPKPPCGFLIGKDKGSGRPVYAFSRQLDRHLLIVGGTGCGKTTLIARLYTEEIMKWQ
jgi:hypothetical protein